MPSPPSSPGNNDERPRGGAPRTHLVQGDDERAQHAIAHVDPQPVRTRRQPLRAPVEDELTAIATVAIVVTPVVPIVVAAVVTTVIVVVTILAAEQVAHARIRGLRR